MNKLITPTRLLVMAGVCLCIGYTYTLSWSGQIWQNWKAYKTLQQKTRRIEQGPQILQQQSAHLIKLEQQAGQFQSPTLHIPDHLAFVEYLEEICRKRQVRIWALPQEKRKDLEGYVLSTEELSLEGKLKDILHILYQIEYTDQLASIAKANFERLSRRQNGKIHPLLVAHIELKRLNHKVINAK